MTWRDDLAAMKAEVHAAFSLPVTVHFSGEDLAITARHHRKGAVVGEDGYAQAIVTDDRLVFLVADLKGRTLSRGLCVTTPFGDCTLAEVWPVDINQQTVVIARD